MPALKQLTCTVETGADNIPLTEYKTEYADGFVETYIRVPSNEATFSIHLKSHGYIAPGLAMFVFMDGIPQCNRNRRGLTIPTASSKPFDTEIDFRVRQKEDRVDSRKFIGREWTFAQLNTVAPDKSPDTTKEVLRNIGTIEVVVLRCYGDNRPSSNTQLAQTKDGDIDTGVGVDGTTDARKSLRNSGQDSHFTTERGHATTAMSVDGASDSHGPSQRIAKPYWQNWGGTTTSPGDVGVQNQRNVYIAPEQPLFNVPEGLAQHKNMSHQVRAGKGKIYHHSTGTPHYLDTMKVPYAVFVFNYRSREALERMIPGIRFRKDRIPLEDRLKKMSVDELVEYTLKLKDRAGSAVSSDEDSSDGGKSIHSAGRDAWTSNKAENAEGEVSKQQSPRKEEPKKKGKTKKKKKANDQTEEDQVTEAANGDANENNWNVPETSAADVVDKDVMQW